MIWSNKKEIQLSMADVTDISRQFKWVAINRQLCNPDLSMTFTKASRYLLTDDLNDDDDILTCLTRGSMIDMNGSSGFDDDDDDEWDLTSKDSISPMIRENDVKPSKSTWFTDE